MKKTILITGSTDGIGYEAAKDLLCKGHRVLLHGRDERKLSKVQSELLPYGELESYLADLSDLKQVIKLGCEINKNHEKIDVLINNAGILKAHKTITKDGLDVRFVVNAISPYLLTKTVLPIMDNNGRIINVSSAAQSPVNIEALRGNLELSDMDAYSQSKLAINMWSYFMATNSLSKDSVIISVNPGSLLASKMVKEGFGVEGSDIKIGSDILVRLSLDEEFKNSSGKYYDNDSKKFNLPHPDGLDIKKCEEVVDEIKNIITQFA